MPPRPQGPASVRAAFGPGADAAFMPRARIAPGLAARAERRERDRELSRCQPPKSPIATFQISHSLWANAG
eukprot:CAMPEP_0206011404 /NCGR_PEP_ID=MMETSP1464-20131121/13174_1 /ASSEMBLY_ACC=CAM_ASM_001124 /TAXON_ID=119497 /ORGANISM="Exanthemachrysis gayraliae, Strain RCC1523" /LENGTH=70 /DNA_ID=CAMNT_0053385067 /DNA_START=125 /DNA_END=334 /DNA_ORIENTATION=+